MPVTSSPTTFEEAVYALNALYREHVQMKMLLASIVESSHDAIFSKTLDGIITSWNGSAERMYEYTAEEATGQSVAMLLPPDRSEELDDIMNRLKRGERVAHHVTVRRAKSGRLVLVSVTISPILDVDGTPVGASSIAHELCD
jgi:PAS domain S-box-containing protein